MESMPSAQRARQEALLWRAFDRGNFDLNVLVQSRRLRLKPAEGGIVASPRVAKIKP